jgi:para-nitrobenzyl esterase
MAMPAARGLFRKAVIQSGPGLTAKPKSEADKITRELLAKLGVDTPQALAAVPTETLSRVSVTVGGEPMRLYAPVLDGAAIPRHPFEPDASPLNADVPLLIGTNKDESTLFLFGHPRFGEFTEDDVAKIAGQAAGEKANALLAALARVYPDYSPTHLAAACQTATGMWRGSVKLAERKAAQGSAPVFMYMLTWETPVSRGRLRCPHALEIPLVFDNVEKARNFVGRGDDPQRVADQMSDAWLAFARTGDPGWPAYEPSRRSTMLFDVESRLADDPLPEIRQLVC